MERPFRPQTRPAQRGKKGLQGGSEMNGQAVCKWAVFRLSTGEHHAYVMFICLLSARPVHGVRCLVG